MMCTRTTILSIPVKRNPNTTPDDVIIQKVFSLILYQKLDKSMATIYQNILR